MKNIYIAFVSTPGIFASVIRTVLKQKYVHVAISLDLNLKTMLTHSRYLSCELVSIK
ncbi:hypothetical protein SAMN02745243_04087 [Hespellia stercorisuis DSM 15480]|uniref:Uncharacterized protein n=1 Tax=Hespellia stercorisuis DSM 15480 TaxID=1121950 RepID=A0A1M6WSF1_9FIRM|nr:hypothetical protein SAMN02745243_04087 [Hespellia stercorisuis DSM 15480]